MTESLQPFQPALRGLSQEALCALFAEKGIPAFRGKQVFHWVQKKGVRDFEAMRNLPKELRARLAEETRFGGIAETIAEKPSADGSVKFLFALDDGKKIESVLMPGSGADADKMTLCVSSQVGCAVDCKFCVTGKNGFFRQMTTAEIVDQALYARHYLARQNDGRLLRNIVFMGMGEPLLNTENVIPAIRLMIDHEGMDLSPRRITVSTSGILPGLDELAQSGMNAMLAISLNAPTQEEREVIMPITRKYPLADLMEACRRYPLRGGARITFEYVLMAGFNDSRRHAREIIRLVHGIPTKINVIPFNPDPALPYQRPTDEAVLEFAEVIRAANLTCSIRWSKALDVSGACGQLAGQYRQKTSGGYVVLPRE
ncbi:MAG: rRNA (adenine2503-C2)-methyltransferase [Candidatus Sumerlaeota bacterium]|nr:rRNA (adenine2503-C2)-methyltransferase [Candidatus Sumerlaeota bacterium]